MKRFIKIVKNRSKSNSPVNSDRDTGTNPTSPVNSNNPTPKVSRRQKDIESKTQRKSKRFSRHLSIGNLTKTEVSSISR